MPDVSLDPVFAPGRRPSRRHQIVAWLLPRLRRTGELDSVEAERARVVAGQVGLEPRLPTRLVPRFSARFSLTRDDTAGFPAWVFTPRSGPAPTQTVFYLHGGGYTSPIDPFHVRWTARLADATGARIVMPDYPLAPDHTWRDSYEGMVDLATRYAEQAAAQGGEMVLAGDSAGGGYALALAQSMRDAAGPQAGRMVLFAPWVDLTDSTPEETALATRNDPWLFVSKIHAYARWWAGSAEDLGRPEVSPVLGSLAGLPPTLVQFGTRDTLVAGCRLLVRRAAEAGWDLTAVEEPGLLHVYPLFPGIPESDRAFDQVLAFLGS